MHQTKSTTPNTVLTDQGDTCTGISEAVRDIEKRLNGASFTQFYSQLKVGNPMFVTTFVFGIFWKKEKLAISIIRYNFLIFLLFFKSVNNFMATFCVE